MVGHAVARVAQTSRQTNGRPGGPTRRVPSRAKRVTGAFADATGRTDEQLRWAVTMAVAVGVAEEGLIGTLRLLNRLDDLGFVVFGHTRSKDG